MVVSRIRLREAKLQICVVKSFLTQMEVEGKQMGMEMQSANRQIRFCQLDTSSINWPSHINSYEGVHGQASYAQAVSHISPRSRFLWQDQL